MCCDRETAGLVGVAGFAPSDINSTSSSDYSPQMINSVDS